MKIIQRILFFGLFLMMQVSPVFAAVPDISGTYSGTDFGTSGGGAAGVDPVSDVYLSQAGSDFTTSIKYTATTGKPKSFTFHGVVDSLANVSGNFSFNASDPVTGESWIGSGTFSGVFESATNKLILNYNGIETLYDNLGNPIGSGGIFGHFELFRVSTAAAVTVVTQNLIQGSVKQTTMTISHRISSIIKPQPIHRVPGSELSMGLNEHSFKRADGFAVDGMFSDLKFNEKDPLDIQINNGVLGLSAGDAEQVRGFWVNISSSDIDDNNTATESDADVTTYIAGYDQKINDKTLLGVALTYEDVEVDTQYNDGKLLDTGITISPYISYSLNESMALYAIAGYAWIDYEQDKANKTVTSELDAERYFIELNFMGYQVFDKVILTERVGYLYTHEKQDSYTEKFSALATESKVKSNSISFSQIKANIEVSYAGEELEPYFDLGYQYDTDYEKASGINYDRAGGNYTFGMRFFFTDQLSGDVSASNNFNRHKLKETNFSGTIRYKF